LHLQSRNLQKRQVKLYINSFSILQFILKSPVFRLQMLESWAFIARLDTSGSARQKPGCTEASPGKANRMKTLEYKSSRKFLLDKHVDFHKPLAILSGGLDSSVLLYILVRIFDHDNIRAIHVCHNIRSKEELERERIFLQKTCKAYSIPITIVNIRQGAISEYAHRKNCGIEAAARHYRYHALVRTAQRFGISTIVTAHQADDQAETFLLRLVRGGRLETLGGISASRLVDSTKRY